MTVAWRAAACVLGLIAVAVIASAQDPTFDVDDFVAPASSRVMFVSRLVTGGLSNPVDEFRPVGQDALFVHVANSLYWSDFQLDYKRSEVRGSEERGRANVQTCRCSPPIYFPTPPSREATPAAPLPGSTDTVQLSWYRHQSTSPEGPPVTLRTRVTANYRSIDTTVTSIATGQEVAKLSGNERTFGIDTDLAYMVGSHRWFGSLVVRQTTRDGTTDNRKQTVVGYVARLPLIAMGGNILLRPTLTVGAASGRGLNGLNILNPAFEAYWYHSRSEVSVHLVLSPLMYRDGIQSWRTTNQIGLFVDRAVFVFWRSSK
jgi:hypothetical protein